MSPLKLLRWQWENYPRAHTHRTNLLIHIWTAPMFCVGTVLLAVGLAQLRWPLLVLGLAGLLIPLIAQGRGHRLESIPPAPFTGPWNFVARLVLEQWITFPRFVLSGRWWRSLMAA